MKNSNHTVSEVDPWFIGLAAYGINHFIPDWVAMALLEFVIWLHNILDLEY